MCGFVRACTRFCLCVRMYMNGKIIVKRLNLRVVEDKQLDEMLSVIDNVTPQQ